jgi:uncharacterized lipoprotein YajG
MCGYVHFDPYVSVSAFHRFLAQRGRSTMRSKLALALAAAALLAACTQSPTASAPRSGTAAPRYDDTGSTATTTPGGNGMGGGH